MILIIGGAYQGKLAFAESTFGLTQADIFTCEEAAPVFGSRCIDHLERFTYYCAVNHLDAVEYFRENEEKWADSVLICEDISCGIVPLGADMRAWREMNGRLCLYLSQKAARVSRIFCGLEQRLK